jgi:cytochrome c553
MSLRNVLFALGVMMTVDAVGGSAGATTPNPKAGAAISGQCAACHGSNGISVANNIPNLAGQRYQYLLRQLEAYKNGARKSPLMQGMAASLSEQQMKDIAAYFATVRIRVSPSDGSEMQSSHRRRSW